MKHPEFTQLLDEALPRAYAAALHFTRDPLDAEDVVQEAAMLAFRGFTTFAPGSNFRAWFLKIVTNVFLMRCRKEKKSRDDVSLDDVPELFLYERTSEVGLHDGGSDPAEAFFSGIETERVTRAIQSLPLQYRAAATLYFVEDLSYAEIGSILECPVGTVRSRLHRARALLQRELWQSAVDCGLVSAARGEELSAAAMAF